MTDRDTKNKVKIFKEFNNFWTIDKLKNMDLTEYTNTEKRYKKKYFIYLCS